MQALKYLNSLGPSDIITWWVSKHCNAKIEKLMNLVTKSKSWKGTKYVFWEFASQYLIRWWLGAIRKQTICIISDRYHITPYGIMGGNELMDRFLISACISWPVWLKFDTWGNSYLELTHKQLGHFLQIVALLFTTVHNECNISTWN